MWDGLPAPNFVRLLSPLPPPLPSRCVEAWSMVMPWVGFPLRKLLSLVQPLPGAKYVRFESAVLPAAMPSVKQYPSGLFPGVPWPYVEGLAIGEAWNDLGFLAVGQYQAALTVQSGGPIRLIVSKELGRV